MLKPANAKFLDRITSLSVEQAERLAFEGHLAQRDYDRFLRIHEWAAPRTSSWAQERHYNRYGYASYLAKMNRLRRVLQLPQYPLPDPVGAIA
jgi:hypothetical protein